MPETNNPNLDATSDYKLDPYFQAQQDWNQRQQEEREQTEKADEIENAELTKQAEEEEQAEKRNPVHKAAHATIETAAQLPLGVADFASDLVGIVPWLKPVDDWWDANSPRATHPGHKLLRDASSVIIPSLAGGWGIVGKAAAATKAMSIPKYARTLGAIAAYTGVDTTVAMVSSHSKTDDNMAATLNNWLGWNIPWATRQGDGPDERWKKNVFESAGMAGSVELLGAAFTFGRKAKLFPRDAGAEQAIKARNAKVNQYEDPLTAAVEPRQIAREAAQRDEMIDAIKADPTGENYNAFVNDLGDDAAQKAVINLEADPLEAKLHQAQIQQNIGTYNGRATSVADEAFNKNFMKAINGDERAKQLDQLFESISPSFDAVVDTGVKEVKIDSETMNKAVDNLTQAIYGKDLNLREFEAIVDDMKSTVYGTSRTFLDEEQLAITSKAFRSAYEKLFDPNQMRASAMLTQQAADNVADAATAARMLGDEVNNSRQMEIIFKKLNLLGSEVKANEFIVNKAKDYKALKATGDAPATVRWLNQQSDAFDEYLSAVKQKNTKLENELLRIAKEDPLYLKPFKEIYDATNGNVDQLDKMHRFTEKHIGLIKKGFIDQDPEVPSMVVKGLHGARINSILSGLSPLRAAVGNSMLTFAKPISVLAGAKLTGQTATYKRAIATYGGITENIKRGFKVMRDEWRLANSNPEEAMMRGRADLRQSKIEKMEYMDTMADAWRADGEMGKVAMWNIAKGLSWWNKQSFVKYGTNALYAIDGFTNSFMASGMARARAYDELFDQTRGSIDWGEFANRQKQLYSEAFDSSGVLTDEAAKHASREIALNLDNDTVQRFEHFLDAVPAARGLFLFPRTGVNALELGWSFNPMSNLGPAMTKARRALGAKTQQQKLAVLAEHGIDATQDADIAFQTLRSEYIGRQIMGSSVVMGVGLWALEGNITGSGPSDDAERRRMQSLGWKPYSIKNPITGEWRSYQGFEPFASLMGITSDVVFEANRVDSSVTEDTFRKIAYSISMNVTNSTFISGFEPLVGLVSGDAGAWTRFWANQTDQHIPFKGVRSILNNIVSPQLKDVNNDYFSYLKNANKFLFSGDENLPDMLDIYTGKPINAHDPLTRASNAFMPVFKSNGGQEPWRQWLLSTGWDNLQKIRRDKVTKQPLSVQDRQWINNWIAKNANLSGSIQKLMTENDGYWQDKLKEYVKAKGLKDQSEWPVKQFILYRQLDRIHDRAFDAAWLALEVYRDQNYSRIGREIRNRNRELQRGKTGSALKHQTELQRLLRETRNK